MNKLALKYHTNSIRNKLAFEVAHEGYQNQKENLQQQQQQIARIKQGQIDENETVEIKVIDGKKKKNICRWFLLKHENKKLLTKQKKSKTFR